MRQKFVHENRFQTESKTKQRKNTVNPIAQVKKLGDKAGRMDFLLID